MFKLPEVDEVMIKALRDSASNDYRVAIAAQRMLAEAITVPLRQGIMDGDIVTGFNIFAPQDFAYGQAVEYPLDFLTPGSEDEYSAFTIPNYGRIPEKHIEGDFLQIPTYQVGAAIDWALKYARDARWDIVARALAVLENMFVRKMNYDAWRCLIAAMVDRNVQVYDDAAPAGFLTKRLISLAKTQMRRSGGGNLASMNQIYLTDAFISPEGAEDIRSWDLTQIDDVTRRDIFLSPNGGLSSIFGVRLHELIELGVGQVFQTYFTSLGGSLTGTDTELGIGLCLVNDLAGTSFVMPVRERLAIFEDEQLHRQRRQGYYGWQEHGFAVLDNRKVLALSY